MPCHPRLLGRLRHRRAHRYRLVGHAALPAGIEAGPVRANPRKAAGGAGNRCRARAGRHGAGGGRAATGAGAADRETARSAGAAGLRAGAGQRARGGAAGGLAPDRGAGRGDRALFRRRHHDGALSGQGRLRCPWRLDRAAAFPAQRLAAPQRDARRDPARRGADTAGAAARLPVGGERAAGEGRADRGRFRRAGGRARLGDADADDDRADREACGWHQGGALPRGRDGDGLHAALCALARQPLRHRRPGRDLAALRDRRCAGAGAAHHRRGTAQPAFPRLSQAPWPLLRAVRLFRFRPLYRAGRGDLLDRAAAHPHLRAAAPLRPRRGRARHLRHPWRVRRARRPPGQPRRPAGLSRTRLGARGLRQGRPALGARDQLPGQRRLSDVWHAAAGGGDRRAHRGSGAGARGGGGRRSDL